MMGGSESVDFLAPSGSGENTLVTCENGDFAADLEVAHAVPRAPEFPAAARRAGGDRDARASTTIEALAELLGIDAGRDVEGDAGRRRRTARSCSRSCAATTGSSSRSSRRRCRPTSRPSTEDEIRAAFGADPGSLGPVGFDGEIVADEALREGQFVAGANRTGWHLRGVEHGRDYEARFADLREPQRGRPVPPVRRRAALPDRDRGRPHLQARHPLLGAARRDVPRRGRHREAAGDGQLRHRPRPDHGRGRRAAPRRERDPWPAAIAPYDVHVVVLPGRRGAGARRRRARSSEAGARRPARRPRPPRGREVRRRRPDRPARCASRSARRRSRTAWSTCAIAERATKRV